MSAPVYRHLESQSTIAGLSLPGFLTLLGLAFPAIQFLSPGTSLLVLLVAYLAMRFAGLGRAGMYWQHRLTHHWRRWRCGGRLGAAGCARTPRFPWGPYRSRALH